MTAPPAPGPAASRARPCVPGPLTVPERTGNAATSSWAEVMAFLDAVAAAGDPRVVRTDFGTSEQGRALPLVVVADPPVSTPAEARAGGRPVVLVMANIHAGEVEGKEACLRLLREVVWGECGDDPCGGPDGEPFDVSRLVLLVAPIYNADGNEAWGPTNRPKQNGPALTGQRANASGLDLNRDYLKLESREARCLVALLAAWDPHVVVDLHTTNGSAHGYELTYSPPLSPSVHPELAATLARDWLPTLRERVRARHGYELFDYGNFEREDGEEGDTPDALRGWRTFDHRPRFGNNAVGLRNRLAILSEAYSYADFGTRIAATRAFVLEILRLVSERGPDVPAACRRWDAETVRAGEAGELRQATGARLASRGIEPVLLRGFREETDAGTGRTVRIAEGPRTSVELPIFAGFEPTGTAAAPRAYVLPPRVPLPGGGKLELGPVVERLRLQGLRLETLAAPRSLVVEVARLAATSVAEAEFQGHRERRAEWALAREELDFPAGSVLVPLDQPLARIAFQLLDPRADDGLVAWNAFDAVLAAGPGAELPVYSLR